jgi:hypothetical protein
MVFVADDLGAWQVGVLADAGRKKLTTPDSGQRAGARAAVGETAAVQRTAESCGPAMRRRPGSWRWWSGRCSASLRLDAAGGAGDDAGGTAGGIAGQLAVLDDASLTGTGQSSADVLGVPGTVVAAKLTGHLLREIVVRGARGGPLFPLASQLNDDVTHEDAGGGVRGLHVDLVGAQVVDVRIPGTGGSAWPATWGPPCPVPATGGSPCPTPRWAR